MSIQLKTFDDNTETIRDMENAILKLSPFSLNDFLFHLLSHPKQLENDKCMYGQESCSTGLCKYLRSLVQLRMRSMIYAVMLYQKV